jgi:hypothetical protein
MSAAAIDGANAMRARGSPSRAGARAQPMRVAPRDMHLRFY